MSERATREAVATVWRMESARLVGALVRFVRDVDLAEDLAQDALVAALERWPESGIPRKPGAWLLATAKDRAVDRLRHRQMRDRSSRRCKGRPSWRSAEGYVATGGDRWVLHPDAGPYTLQAAIAACHARALTPEDTDWPQIVSLYDALVGLTGSPVVELNRAMAVSMAYGAEAAVEQVDALSREREVLERRALSCRA